MIDTIEMGGVVIRVRRKKMKNMTLRVCASTGQVNISAPMQSSDVSIRRFAATHIEWIHKHTLQYHQNNLDNRYFIWGREYIIREHEAIKPSILISEDTYLDVRLPIDSTSAQREKALNTFYKKLLHAQLESLIPRWEAVIGQSAAQYQLRLMKSRWGSCCPHKRKICLNVSLVKYPLICLEYVLVHELVHLLEASHNARFKALMDQFMPNWRTYKAILNNNFQDDKLS